MPIRRDIPDSVIILQVMEKFDLSRAEFKLRVAMSLIIPSLIAAVFVVKGIP